MKIVKIIGISLLAIVVFVLIIGVMASSEVKMERSITINANAASIFEEINDMVSFNAWSPWSDIDPEGTKYTYEGPEFGVGNKMTWASDHEDVGSGSQEIVESVENEMVRTKLFFGGFDEPSYADVTIEEGENSSTVIWTYEGDMGANPINKIAGLFMDAILGSFYEKGLNSLKEIVESKPTFSVEIGTEQAEVITYLAIRKTFLVAEADQIGDQMGELYGQIGAHMASNNIQPLGAPFSVYITNNETEWEADIAMPVSADITDGSGDIQVGTTTGGKVVKAVHMGDYMKLDATHAEVARYMEYNKLESSGYPYEIYLTDPSTELDTAKWRTDVYYPVN